MRSRANKIRTASGVYDRIYSLKTVINKNDTSKKIEFNTSVHSEPPQARAVPDYMLNERAYLMQFGY